ncbi:LRR receptor kinase BAK1 [Linum perenne]
MAISLFFFLSFTLFYTQSESLPNPELKPLLEFKSSLDPESKFLTSWTVNGDPCDGSFEGVGCNENGQVANISLQGKGLRGKISPAVSQLKNLSGLYLHYNELYGEVPAEVGNLTELVDLYLNVNNLSGEIPPAIGNLGKLQVLQLCYNQFTGSVPVQLGTLKKLNVLELQSNRFTGAIPASLGNLGMLMRLDLSFNRFFGSIPMKLADAPVLESLDIRNNTFSGNVPLALKRLNEGFLFANNPGLCGSGFMYLRPCNSSEGTNSNKPEPYGQAGKSTREIPETADLTLSNQSASTHKHQASLFIIGSLFTALTLLAISALSYTHYRRKKQKLSDQSSVDPSPRIVDPYRKKNGSPLISLEYPNGWDPLADHGRRNCSTSTNADAADAGSFDDALFHSFKFNLEEIETATQYFSETNVLGGKANSKSNSVTYKGILRDGSAVAVKSISKSSCKSDEAEFLRGLNVLTCLSHENLVRFRGFCCSRGRGECFVVCDFVPNGNLMRHLDVGADDAEDGGLVLEWSTRVSIVKGIAKGIAYLHSNKTNKPPIIHQAITAEKILIDKRYNPLLSGSGLQSLLTNDAVFSALKASAAMGYMAPEYSTTGKFTDKSDVYAFGVIVFQVLSGKRKVSNLVRMGADACRFEEYLDPNLKGRFFEYEAAKLARVAWLCTHELPVERPSMEGVVQELGKFSSCI